MQSDQIIEAAEKELAALDAQRQEIAKFIERYKRYKGVAASAPVPLEGTEGTTSSTRKSASPDAVMSAVHDILEARNDALPLAPLYDALLERGVEVGGQHPKQNLSQKLSAHEGFKSYGKFGWYFADREPLSVQKLPRLPDERDDDEEGPVIGVTRPLQTNGATDFHSEAPGEGRAPV